MADSSWNTIYKKKLQSYTYYDLREPHEDMVGISDFFKHHSVNSILDLGCGTGRNAVFLAAQGFAVSGIDSAAEGLAEARRVAHQADHTLILTRGDIYQPLPYDTASFDAVISIQVLQHNTREHIQNALAECARIIKPGGYLFLTVCGRYSQRKVRYCLIKTARKIAAHTYIPTLGDEQGLTHFIYTKRLLAEDMHNFTTIKQWKDSRDYYAVLAQKTPNKHAC